MSLSFTALEQRYQELIEQLSLPDLAQQVRQQLQKEASYLSDILAQQKTIQTLEQSLAELTAQQQTADDEEMRALFAEEVDTTTVDLRQARNDLDDLLFPPDPDDAKSAFVEIRAGTGGQEAALFAGDLMRMYTAYAQSRRWKVELFSASPTDLGGYREVVLDIQGKGVFGHLKYESGVHRVQRVPQTETAGRVHTSTATVAVMPEADEVDITIDPTDLRIDVFRASGAGGQHVNTTDSAVRITHIPTGVVVSCQDERSQHKNKAKALKMLSARIVSAHKEKEAATRSQHRKSLIGSGDRSEKVRTYNFPQNRVADHRIGLTLKKLDLVIEGELGEIIEALRDADRQERRQQPLPKVGGAKA